MEEEVEVEEEEHNSGKIVTNKHTVAEENKAKRRGRCLLGCVSRCLLTQPRQNVQGQDIFILFFLFLNPRTRLWRETLREKTTSPPLLN